MCWAGINQGMHLGMACLDYGALAHDFFSYTLNPGHIFKPSPMYKANALTWVGVYFTNTMRCTDGVSMSQSKHVQGIKVLS